MSQELTPVTDPSDLRGLSPTLNTTTNVQRLTAFSRQYREANKLFRQPTQWVPAGRPIYRRLPAASQTYQVDFFTDGSLGYVLIPPGNDQFGAGSLYVDVSSDREALLIYDGAIVWEAGTTPVLKAIVDLQEIGVKSGRWLVAYQLLYSDAPVPLPFRVSDFSLAGLDLEIQDSASQTFEVAGLPNGNPWPYPGGYLFTPSSSGLSWKNFTPTVNQVPQSPNGVVPGFPETSQPLLAFVEWSSPHPWHLDQIRVRSSSDSPSQPPCTLQYLLDEEWYSVQTSDPQLDGEGYYWEFLTETDPQKSWRLEWPVGSKIEAYGLTVSGILVLDSKPSTPRAYAQLALYPENMVPEDQTLCRLAIINVNEYLVQEVPLGNGGKRLLKDDIRNIATRDYEPVADWLTQYWDERLIDDWEKVSAYAPVFMAPPTLLKTGYYDLEDVGIEIDVSPPPLPPPPPAPTEVHLLAAYVTISPPIYGRIIDASVLIGEPAPGSPVITDIEVIINPPVP